MVKAVLLAAGKGVRMRPLTSSIPKAMVKLAGKPMVEWQLESLEEAGVDEVAIIVGHKKEVIERHFGGKWNGIKLTYIHQEKQEGTGHAVKHARDFVEGEHFVVAYCDVIVGASLYSKLANVNEFADYEVLMCGREVKDPWRYGVLVVQDEKVVDMVEKPKYGEEPSNIINAGVYQFSAKIFDELDKLERSSRGEYELTDAIMPFIKQGKVRFIGMCEGICMDIGTKEDLEEAEKQLRESN